MTTQPSQTEPHDPTTNLDQLTEEHIASLDFDEALRLIQLITQQLEGQQVPLERAVTLYQQGVALSERCQKKLDQAKLVLEQYEEKTTDPKSD